MDGEAGEHVAAGDQRTVELAGLLDPIDRRDVQRKTR
jgi:hypothetical protein